MLKCPRCGYPDKPALAQPEQGMVKVSSEEDKKKIVASLLVQLWITLPQVPVGTMPNYEQAWDIAQAVLAAAPSAGKE